MQASSTWRLVGNSDCATIEKERTADSELKIGTTVAIPYSFHGEVFNSWIRTAEEKATGPNYVGILTVGCYTSSKIDYDCENVCDLPETDIIDIGDADENVTRWWYGILAQREGWKAIVKRTPHREFLAPWTVSRTCETRFAINHKLSPTSSYTPLSAEKAFYVLAEFALLHNLGSQFPIALMTAPTLPTHEHYGSTVQLPLPRSFGGKQPTPMEAIPSIWYSLNEELPYYMTLSCSPEVVMSTLCGSFWEPEVPCNLVAPWLHPLLNEVLQQDEKSPTVSQDYETLALIGAIRRPNIGALWIGAVVGELAPKVVKKVQTVYPPLNAVSFPWTGCLQTFMDLPGSGPYTYGSPEQISRPDVWRLLHLPQTEDDELFFRQRPGTSWEPWGSSSPKDCALRVTSHLKCARHEYQYHHWNWELEGGVTIRDQGFSTSTFSTAIEHPSDLIISEVGRFPKREPDQLASEEASLYIFRWLSNNAEGKPSEAIYQDEWLRGIWEDEEEDWEAEESNDRDSKGSLDQLEERVEAWLKSIC